MPNFNKPKKRKKIGIRIILILLILFIYFFTKKITLEGTIAIQQGENVSQIFAKLSTREQFRMKLYLFTHRKSVDFSKLESGNYIFSGGYTKAQFVAKILEGPDKNIIRPTLLEGRSIYDIDAGLARKGYIATGEYIAFVTDPTIIAKYQERYEFLNNSTLNTQHSTLETLEGFLYPDTYQVDRDKNIIDQLVYLQLENFKKKVRSQVSNPSDRYDTIILASILEKEERNTDNKATVAGIFLKRLDIGMKLDADITLCYGIPMAYYDCKPEVIAKYINSTSNIYNTRTHGGLTPTPICSPTRESVHAILHPQNSNYLYYLHDNEGYIHYGTTLDEHNANKAKYLQ